MGEAALPCSDASARPH